MSKRIILVALALTVLSGCQVTDKRAHSLLVGSLGDKPRQFILLGTEQYEGELTFALVEQGFNVKLSR